MCGSGLNHGDGWKKGKIITVARVDSFRTDSGGGATVFINVFLLFSAKNHLKYVAKYHVLKLTLL